MNVEPSELLQNARLPVLDEGTLVLAFSGWMDGGDVSTGTVGRLLELLEAGKVAEVDPEPFYITSFPGSMEIASLFRPHIEIVDGLVQQVQLPSPEFYSHEEANLLLFRGREPNLGWRAFADVLFHVAHQCGIRRLLFVGSFGGSVPHTREPRLYVTCSSEDLLHEMESYGVRRTGYEGPGSFTSYLMTRVADAGLEMVSLIVEIPGYLQGPNPASIEAVTRRLSKILQLPLELDALRSASTEWELQVSSAIEEDEDLLEKIREMERAYDDELLERGDV